MRAPYSLLFLLTIVTAAHAGSITVGPYTFDDLAFADTATQLDAGTLSPINCTTAQNCLTGFSPDAALVNLGFDGNANLFELGFSDLLATNGAGADIIFFSARFSDDPWSIAVHPQGGSYTSFVNFAIGDSIDTGVTGVVGAELFALPIDLSSFGLGAGVTVDAFQIKALPNQGGATEGDAVMAAVFNGATSQVPEPASGMLLAAGLSLGVLYSLRKQARGTR